MDSDLVQQMTSDGRAGDRWQEAYWEGIERGEIMIQRCESAHPQFPGGPNCASCGAAVAWTKVSGRGWVWSWVVFHHRYLDAFDPPYTAMIVELEEGVKTFAAPDPDQEIEPWIGAPVELKVGTHRGRRVSIARVTEDEGKPA